MRPINLIPPEQRRGLEAPIRTGPLAYLTVGALAAILIAVVAVVSTNNSIGDRRGELASLEQRKSAADTKLKSLQSFASMRSIADQRTATVSNLAGSRFDWVRVMDEFSRILPSDVWLVGMTATVRPGVEVDSGAKVSTRSEVDGPALEIVGCTTSQNAVAGFVSDIKDIDGVTRVGVSSSKRPERSTSGSQGSGGQSGSDECRTADSITRFEIVAAFDNVPNPSVPQAAPGASPSSATSTGGPTALVSAR
jgi:Tfp pilus assembly protein PilN